MYLALIVTVASTSAHMPLHTSKMEATKWSSCPKPRLRNVEMQALEEEVNTHHGTTITRKWPIKLSSGTCGSTCLFRLNYNKQSHMTKEQHDPLKILRQMMICF